MLFEYFENVICHPNVDDENKEMWYNCPRDIYLLETKGQSCK